MWWFQRKIDQVEQNANEAWKRAAYDRVRDLAQTRWFFTSEDVLSWLADNGYKTKDNRALGAIMQHYQKEGVIEARGWSTAKRRERHHAPVRVWQSLVKDNPWKDN